MTAFTATIVAEWWLARGWLSRIALDYPNRRSLHETPVPRTGGIGVHLGILVAWAIVAPKLPSQTWIAFALVLVVSFIDDMRGVPVVLRLVVHLAAAGILAVGLLFPQFGPAGVVIATFAIAWMANLYNFMDGSDGLAGGMACFGFLFYGIAAWLSGSTSFALLNFSIAAAAAAFMIFNFHPARIFLGDVGSIPLGFLAAALGLVGWLQRDWTWWFPVLVFSPFIVDATVTLLKRLAKGEKIWQPHREHYYQRLVQIGWGHRKTALIEYLLMLIAGLSSLWALSLSSAGQIIFCMTWAVAYSVLMVSADRAWRAHLMAGSR